MSNLKNLAIDLSVERFNRSDKQIADTLGHEDTARGRAVSDQCLPRLVDYLKTFSPPGGPRAPLWEVLKQVAHDRLAAAILSGAIHVIGRIGNDDDDEGNDATLRAASGLQHYCLLMRDKDGGERVNLVPRPRPQEAYRTISEDMSLEQTDAGFEEIRPGVYAAVLPVTQAQVIAGALGRKLTKGPTVTRFYGRKDKKQADQLRKDHKWIEGEHVDPVSDALLRGMDPVFPRPAEAMRFIQCIAALLAEENKSLSWATPTGFPWQIRARMCGAAPT